MKLNQAKMTNANPRTETIVGAPSNTEVTHPAVTAVGKKKEQYQSAFLDSDID